MNSQFSEKNLNSRIHYGEVFHQRTRPCLHTFSYPLFTLRISIDELPLLEKNAARVFAYNRFGLFSIKDTDYLSQYEGSLKQKVKKTLQNQGINEDFERIELITHPRILNYVFNPVSFFLCYRHNSELGYVIAEVHNTFNEKHIYVLGNEENKSDILKNENFKDFSFYECDKAFHVSPFFDRSGKYLFSIKNKENEFDIRVSLFKEEEMQFTSRLKSKVSKPWGTLSLIYSSIKYPGSIILTMPRIIYQAAQLKWRRNLPVYTKPIAVHPMTINKEGPGILQRFSLSFFDKFLENTKYGSISFNFGNNELKTISGSEHGKNAVLDVHNYDLFLKSLLAGDVGFGEAYVDGDWSSDNLLEVLQFFCENQHDLNDRLIRTSYLGRFKNLITHIQRKNTLKKSTSNIQAHYDLSNDLFSSFLDSNMQYSSAYFENESDSLEIAQINKINRLIKKAQINKNDHVLEIGCGWGGLAIHMAKTTGCKVTGITLSDEQKKYAEERIKKEGLEGQISIIKSDYRNMRGTFSKIISVEMIEAVGHEFLEAFFKTCNNLLEKNGLLVLQAITMPEQRYLAYKKGCDWIQKYIFPGGHCPSIESLLEATRTSSSFALESTEDIGQHYAKTLSIWRNNFNNNWNSISKFGFDERFKRIWNYYLTYCEAGFSTKLIYTHQMVFSKL